MDTDTTNTPETTPEITPEITLEDTGGKKRKSEPKTIKVLVLRAVSPYHHRGTTLTVPNDEFHRGLLKQGNLKAVR